jgi:hypothetical protein
VDAEGNFANPILLTKKPTPKATLPIQSIPTKKPKGASRASGRACYRAAVR